MPTQPSGEMPKSCTSVIGLVVWNAGAVAVVRRIGRNETETSTDITTKSV